MDTVHRGFDHFALAMAAMLNDRDLWLWRWWCLHLVFPETRVVHFGKVVIHDVDTHRLVSIWVETEKLGRAPAPTHDPLVILSWLSGAGRDHFPTIQDSVARVLDARMSLSKQSHLRSGWTVDSVPGILGDLATIVEETRRTSQRTLSPSTPRPQFPPETNSALDRFTRFAELARKNFPAFHRRKHSESGLTGAKDKLTGKVLAPLVSNLATLDHPIHGHSQKVLRACMMFVHIEDEKEKVRGRGGARGTGMNVNKYSLLRDDDEDDEDVDDE
jgi:hypothetical protein